MFSDTLISPKSDQSIRSKYSNFKRRTGSPNFREILRQRCRERVKAKRNHLFDHFRSLQNGESVRDAISQFIEMDLEEIKSPQENCSEMKDGNIGEFSETPLSQLAATEEERWILEEYERMIESTNLQAELENLVTCPICSHGALRADGQVVVCTLCSLLLPQTMSLPDLERRIFLAVDTHSDFCQQHAQFILSPDDNSASLLLLCSECGGVMGLQNLGLTCFLNTLLQAMASCALFVGWLESCHDQGPVASALFYLLKVLSTERAKLPDDIDDPLIPSELIAALRAHGWSIGPGEQDAHELFHLLMVTMEEEAHKAAANETGLTDALEPRRRNSTGDISENVVESNHTINEPSGDSRSGNRVQPQSLPPVLKLVNRHGEPITRKVLPKYDCNRNYQASPFCGLLTSQLQCAKCKFKSVVRYDKFDSLSLHLPELGTGFARPITLAHLLDQFTQTEAVTGVVCEGCNQDRPPDQPPITATSLKTLSIGKLPRCFCIHIHRMSMGTNGTPYKRADFVDFPEYLYMDPYTQNSAIKERKLKEDKQDEEEVESSRVKSLPCRTGSWNHIYRLKAVVVHCGSVDSGHFVTYRRGPLQSSTRHRSDRWYLTSDESVKDATLAEAMQAAAYMLFYEKCTMTPT